MERHNIMCKVLISLPSEKINNLSLMKPQYLSTNLQGSEEHVK